MMSQMRVDMAIKFQWMRSQSLEQYSLNHKGHSAAAGRNHSIDIFNLFHAEAQRRRRKNKLMACSLASAPLRELFIGIVYGQLYEMFKRREYLNGS
jgi:hypothetical protein